MGNWVKPTVSVLMSTQTSKLLVVLQFQFQKHTTEMKEFFWKLMKHVLTY